MTLYIAELKRQGQLYGETPTKGFQEHRDYDKGTADLSGHPGLGDLGFDGLSSFRGRPVYTGVATYRPRLARDRLPSYRRSRDWPRLPLKALRRISRWNYAADGYTQ